jgi:hypothetical protein
MLPSTINLTDLWLTNLEQSIQLYATSTYHIIITSCYIYSLLYKQELRPQEHNHHLLGLLPI